MSDKFSGMIQIPIQTYNNPVQILPDVAGITIVAREL